MPADSAARARALVHTRALAHAHEHDGPQDLPDMLPSRRPPPPVSLRLPSGSLRTPQTCAQSSARLDACSSHQRVCVPLDAAVTPCNGYAATHMPTPLRHVLFVPLIYSASSSPEVKPRSSPGETTTEVGSMATLLQRCCHRTPLRHLLYVFLSILPRVQGALQLLLNRYE